MKLLVLSAVFCVLVAVSLASPIKKSIRDDSGVSESSESSELKQIHKDSSSSEEEELVHDFSNKEIAKDNSSDDSSEEQPISDVVATEDTLRDEIIRDYDVTHNEYFSKSKRSVDFAPHNTNQLKVKDEGSIKYEKHLRLKRLRRSVDTSEEDSSEEHHAANGIVIAKKPDTAPGETLELATKPDTAPAESLTKPADVRRKRNADGADTSEEDSSEESHGHNDIAASKNPDIAPVETLELAAKPDTAPAESLSKPVDIRRKRNADGADTSEEDSSEESHGTNGVAVSKKLDTSPAETLELAAKPDSAPAENLPKPADIRRKRNTPSTDTSEEDSSEEKPKADGIVIAKKPDAAPAESEPKPEGSRRRRNIEVSSAEDSIPDQDLNEVLIFSNEKHHDTEENFEKETINSNESVIFDERNLENKNSEEDYAQGCGGDDDSNENSNENNDNAVDRF